MKIIDIKTQRPRLISLKPIKEIVFKDEQGYSTDPLYPRDLPCRYCGREFVWIPSRGCHEARCPALTRIPNEIKRLRNELKILESKVKMGFTEEIGKKWAKYIRDILSKHND